MTAEVSVTAGVAVANLVSEFKVGCGAFRCSLIVDGVLSSLGVGSELDGSVDSSQSGLFTEDCKGIEDADAGWFSGQRDAKSIDTNAKFNVSCFSHGFDFRLERGGIPIGLVLDDGPARTKHFDSLWFSDDPFLECGRIEGELVIGEEELVELEDIAGDFDSVCGSGNDAREVFGDRARRRVGNPTGLLEVGENHRHFFLRVEFAHPSSLEGEKFLWIEGCWGFVDAFKGEMFDRIIERKVFRTIVEGPTEQ